MNMSPVGSMGSIQVQGPGKGPPIRPAFVPGQLPAPPPPPPLVAVPVSKPPLPPALNTQVAGKREKQKGSGPSTDSVLEKLREIVSKEDPTTLYKSFVKIGQGYVDL